MMQHLTIQQQSGPVLTQFDPHPPRVFVHVEKLGKFCPFETDFGILKKYLGLKGLQIFDI